MMLVEKRSKAWGCHGDPDGMPPPEKICAGLGQVRQPGAGYCPCAMCATLPAIAAHRL